jgi:hypothetical protein
MFGAAIRIHRKGPPQSPVCIAHLAHGNRGLIRFCLKRERRTVWRLRANETLPENQRDRGQECNRPSLGLRCRAHARPVTQGEPRESFLKWDVPDSTSF